MEDQKEHQSNQYFQLMEIVGTKGRYQKIVLIIFCILVFEVGSLSLGNPYYFANAPYVNCPHPYSSGSECNQYVCSLPEAERSRFLDHQISQIRSIANQFGDFHCQKSDIIATAMGMFFFGSVVGFISMGSIVDNLGRKLTFNLCLLIAVTGNILIVIIPNLISIQIGLFMMGLGLQNAFNLCFYFLSEVFDNKQRQFGAIIIQSCFCVGGLSTILWFYLFKNWKIIFICLYLIPLIVITTVSFFILKQTPRFLIKRHQIIEIRKQFLFIAKMNGREKQFDQSQRITEQKLRSLKQEYQIQSSSLQNIFTFRDLFKFKSLRMLSILLGLVGFSVDFLYYAPLILIDNFGFNFYLNGVIINLSELITYFVSYFLITKLKRKNMALFLFAVAFGCSFILLFIHKNEICSEDCWNAKNVIELLIIFVMRFAISLEFQIYLIYVNELYPTQIAGIGVSYTSIIGTLPNIFLPELINLSNRYNVNVMIYFCAISIVGLVSSKFIKETQGCQPNEKIDELYKKEQIVKQIELIQQKS